MRGSGNSRTLKVISLDRSRWMAEIFASSWHAEYLYCKSNEDGWALTQADFWGRSVQFLKWTGGLEDRRGCKARRGLVKDTDAAFGLVMSVSENGRDPG
ncbi:hypothetical protein EYF80_004417 [Liparis tanakae]|uniref:Uncharacterized protein n=1 Tax=Liparis tanakae TaxID=230148 RepID=A0A4Z2J4V7_9TELE|nr:hypothetical protein EYF80_004417 [Liparis tanakae]